MKKIKLLHFIILLFVISLFETSCKKDHTDNGVSLEINKFIWGGLNYYYLWKDQVPNLSDTKFTSQSSLESFLNQYGDDHNGLFEALLYQRNVVDKFSWIVDDYVALANSFQGISKSMGYEYRLAYTDNTKTNLIAFVLYVLKGSPADKAGIKRGDLFEKVNNTQLTVSNYESLLVNSTSYTISFVTIVNHTITPSSQQASLTAVEWQENPVYLDTVYTVKNNKVGYLVYNGFTSDFDVQLNQAFGKFKEASVNKLVLDLRYNPGGSIQTAIYLASMIYSTDATKTFVKYQYNANVTADLTKAGGNSYFSDHFTNQIDSPQMAINSLGLTDLYVITTDNTASASELIINGLRPYMPNLVTIGTRTVGKNVGSTTVYDMISATEKNPHHKWAMQPIILKISNSANFSDYANGIAPTDSIEEDITNLLPFGNTNEPLLKDALNRIGGTTGQTYSTKSRLMGFIPFVSSKELRPHQGEMYTNKKIIFNH
jgi:carboxyl-terminal processing protease